MTFALRRPPRPSAPSSTSLWLTTVRAAAAQVVRTWTLPTFDTASVEGQGVPAATCVGGVMPAVTVTGAAMQTSARMSAA